MALVKDPRSCTNRVSHRMSLHSMAPTTTPHSPSRAPKTTHHSPSRAPPISLNTPRRRVRFADAHLSTGAPDGTPTNCDLLLNDNLNNKNDLIGNNDVTISNVHRRHCRQAAEKAAVHTMNSPILCFVHCDSRRQVLCLTLPPACPICRIPLTSMTGPFVSADDSLFSSTRIGPSPDFVNARLTSFPESSPSITPLIPRQSDLERVAQLASSSASVVMNRPEPRHSGELCSNWPSNGSGLHRSLASLSSTSRYQSVSHSPSVFRLPSPFRRGEDSPRSIVIRPSRGTFLDDYRLYDDLHIGVADSNGVVHDFDKGGIRVRNNYWTQCLILEEDQLRNCVSSSSTFSSTSSRRWDDALKRCIDVTRWTPDGRDAYDGEINNCLDFVLHFLQLWNASTTTSTSTATPTSSSSSNREAVRLAFTRHRLLPLMESSMKYISLYRKLVLTNVWIHRDA